MIDSLSNLTIQISELDRLFTSLEMLSKKQMPHMLINQTTLWNSLTYLESYLKQQTTDLQLAHRDSYYYYKWAEFHVFRYKQHLIIRLNVPLTLSTLTKPFSIWRVQKIPLASPNQSHYTLLNADFEAILYTPDLDFYLAGKSLADFETHTLDITKQGLILQDRSILTCPLSLIEGDLKDIKKYCGYAVVNSPVPRAVYKLTDDLILLSNVSNLIIQCDNNGTRQVLSLSEIQTVHKLHCSCHLTADHFYIPNSALHCDETVHTNFTYDAKFMINLPYVTSFVGHYISDLISEDALLNVSIPINLPKLAIAGNVYQNRLAIDRDKTFDLALAINQTMNDNQMYSGLSHLLLCDVLKTHLQDSSFDVLNVYSWLQVLFAAVATTSLILAIFLHCRLRTIMLLLAKSSVSAATWPAVIELSDSTSTVPPRNDTFTYWHYHTKLLELVPIDLSFFLFCFLCFFILFLFRYCKNCIHNIRYRNARMILHLEFTDHVQSPCFEVVTLPYNANHYRFVVTKQHEMITLQPHWLTYSL